MAIPVPIPMGRLTLTSGLPVLTADVTAATTIYYTPYRGDAIPLFNPDLNYFVGYTFTELSQTLADATKAPAATAVSSVYDVFIALDGVGNPQMYRGPAWTNDTTRSAGTALIRRQGFLVNQVAITNGPTANCGLYVGTFRTSATGANGQVDMMFQPTAAAGGTANRLFLWNAFNRVRIVANNRDSADSWADTAGTWGYRNGNAASRIDFVTGLVEEGFLAISTQYSQNSTAAFRRLNCVSVDVNNNYYQQSSPGVGIEGASAAAGDPMVAYLTERTQLGVHYVVPLEVAAAGGAATWYGDNGGTVIQTSFKLILRM
jgi:hypothetical protein